MADSNALRALFGLQGPPEPEGKTSAEPSPPDLMDQWEEATRAVREAAFAPARDKPTPLALDCCGTCKFYLGDPIGPAAARMGGAARTVGGNRPGNCRRYPVSVRKTDKEWCGEFHRQPAR